MTSTSDCIILPPIEELSSGEIGQLCAQTASGEIDFNRIMLKSSVIRTEEEEESLYQFVYSGLQGYGQGYPGQEQEQYQ
jgi:hypothetical protein